jgi:hypothetical protein
VLLLLSNASNYTFGDLAEGLMFVASAGVALTAPAWIMFCLIILPVVTHRVEHNKSVSLIGYYSVAGGIGFVLILPIVFWMGIEDWYVALFGAFGGVGGLGIGLAWHLLVLKSVRARNSMNDGVFSA